MGKAEYKVEGGKLVRAQVWLSGKMIQKVKLTGDFFIHPEVFLDELEVALQGCMLDEKVLTYFIRDFAAKNHVILLGVSPEDFARCIVMAGEA